MKELRGISASPGIAIGEILFYTDQHTAVPRYSIESEEVDAEIRRFREAVEKARAELEELKEAAARENNKNGVDTRFLDSHLLMLQDPEFVETAEIRVRERRCNAEWVVQMVVHEIVERLRAIDDQYMRERSVDIHDVSQRIIGHLMYRDRISLGDLNREVVLVTHDLLPSDALSMNKRMVKGIAMDAGGRTSHTAILARAFEIPAVLGLSEITRNAHGGSEIIVDGNRGRVVIDPDPETRSYYEKALQEQRRREVELMSLTDLPAETRDGKLVQLKANIELSEEVEAVFAHGADGVGLFRSEFLFLDPGRLRREEEQFEAYKAVLEQMDERPVTIRTLDIGGDKVIPELDGQDEKNPILGWRAIRFCLGRQDIFRTQLRALLRASVYGRLRLMFPMISGIEELTNALDVLDDVKRELREEGRTFTEDVPVGIMIEVPSAAVTSDILAHRVDFLSIGTNDLIQYTVAVDRGNERVAYLYEPFHPAVLRLIRMVVENGHAAGIPVGMCGEMGGDPMATAVLLGLGLDELSMSAASIPEVKRIIRSITTAEAEELVGTIMEMRGYADIDQYVHNVMRERFDVTAY